MKVDKGVSPTTNLKLVGDQRKTVCETTSNNCHVGGWDADWVAILGTSGKGDEVRRDGLKVLRFRERNIYIYDWYKGAVCRSKKRYGRIRKE